MFGRRKRERRGTQAYSPEERKAAVEGWRRSGMPADEFAQTWGVSGETLRRWSQAYDEGGAAALSAIGRGRGRPKGAAAPVAEPVKRAVLKVKAERPFFGVRRIRAMCARAFGLGVTRRAVERTLSEAGIETTEPRRKKRTRKPPRFERSRPMELWQSDITQFVCPRTQKRIFLCVFLDDRTRYGVGWSVSASQTSEMVLEAYESAVQRYGRPQEVLTDQGRQYAAWRGEDGVPGADGVKHILSRSHHPETLGKCERLRSTIHDEFWKRVEVVSVDDARERLTHWFGAYNRTRAS